MPSPDATSAVLHVDRAALLQAMQARGLNAHRLSFIADVPKRQVRRVLYGYGEATRSVLERLSEALGVNVEQITRRP